jgi:NDP-sugar pyrophosphorylase family protein
MEGVDLLLLCGGLGTRLREVVFDRPKPMADIKGRPFLDILIDHAAGFGVRRFILCAGFKADFIEDHYRTEDERLEIVVSKEAEPLGTAGAIKNAQPLIQSYTFLIMNGDSFCPVALDKFLDFHAGKEADISIALSKMRESAEYGSVKLDEEQRITGFDEKVISQGGGLVNAGIYAFNKAMLDLIPAGRKFSLERELFPNILDKGIFGYVTEKRLVDIGTPERLEIAKGLW